VTYHCINFNDRVRKVQRTKIRWFCIEKVKIEALKGKLFNFNENNENHKVYPSACDSSYETLLIRQKCKQYILKWDAVGSIRNKQKENINKQ
jgi:hypothetical protein